MAGADDPKTGPKVPPDAFAAAAALGVAMTTQALQFWFGVASGLARAGQDALDRQAGEKKAAPGQTGASRPQPEPLAKPGPSPEPEKARAEVTSDALARKHVVAAAVASADVAPKAEKSKTRRPARQAAPDSETADSGAQAQQSAGSLKPKAGREVVTSSDTATPAPVPAASAAAIMPEDFRPPRAVAKPAIPDDLKQLPGVGPKLEQVLNGLGVWTYDQVATWSAEEIAYVEDMTGLNGRIAADNWLEQAAALATGATRH